MRKLSGIPVSMLAALLVAAPAAANETVRWTETDHIDGSFACGVVESTDVRLDGITYFDGDGSWIRDIIRFTYAASFTDLATGETISYPTRQIVEVTPETASLNGQGGFIRVPVAGAVLLDVGRLVVDTSDGSTLFASAQSLPFDPSTSAAYEAAVCSLF